jgi:hypothetical protein
MFENRVLRGMFGFKRQGVTGGLTKLQSKERHNFVRFNKYYQSDRIKEDGALER